MHGSHFRRFLLAGVLIVTATLAAMVRPAVAAGDESDQLLDAVRSAVADGRQKPSRVLGFTPGKEDFTESPSQPGFLVGFDLGVGKAGDGESIYGLRAVFWTPGGDEVLKDHGLWHDKLGQKNKTVKSKVQNVVHLHAKDGYAVGALTLRSGLNINGLSVTFMRIKDGKLDPQDSYESDWVGDRTGGEGSIGGDGAPVVAVAGNQDSEKICALGLVFMTMPAAAVAPPANPKPPVRTAPPVAPPAQPPVQNAPAQPPAAAAVENPPDQPAAPPAAEPAAQEPAAAAATQVSAPASSEQSQLNLFLVYGVPAAAFIAVAGLIAVVALTSMHRRNQPVRRPANRAALPLATALPVAVALPASTGLRERPAAPRPPAAADDVLELVPEDFDPNPARIDARRNAPKAAPPSSDGWPQLEV